VRDLDRDLAPHGGGAGRARNTEDGMSGFLYKQEGHAKSWKGQQRWVEVALSAAGNTMRISKVRPRTCNLAEDRTCTSVSASQA
jgi:hypothetical protein